MDGWAHALNSRPRFAALRIYDDEHTPHGVHSNRGVTLFVLPETGESCRRLVKLRNAHLALVERHKVVDYLLNVAHPDNGGKAQFFESFGFSADVPELLIDALRAVAHTGEVVEIIQSSHGEK